MQITYKAIDSLIPYVKNSRTHSDSQVAQIAASIKEFGFTNPVLLDEHGGIVAGHGRVMAARKLKLSEVPTITLGWLTDAQRRAYVIADNKLALNAGWDDELLKIEVNDLEKINFDLNLLGFDSDELAKLLYKDDSLSDKEDSYTSKVEIPIYKPSDEKPLVNELFNNNKTNELISEIDTSEIPDEIKTFLRFAAARHTVFDFKKIADFYSNADEKVQDLMERSALVIIDFDKAIEEGYVILTNNIMEQYAEDYGNEMS